jgi:endonuclease/exonuclease/phosphatase family metal-dependent hydrolase
MVRLVTADAPDVVALQEVPMWAVRRLDGWSGMAASWAQAMPSMAGPLARRLTELDPQRFRSSASGQANALLVNPHLDAGRHRRIVLNPEVSRLDVLRGAQRRVCQALELEAGGRRILLANLHASNEPGGEQARQEIDRAAAFLAGPDPCILCGDFNVGRHPVSGFSEPTDGIDQILARGLKVDRGPAAWPEERRRVNGAVLSDHAPIEAVIASSS